MNEVSDIKRYGIFQFLFIQIWFYCAITVSLHVINQRQIEMLVVVIIVYILMMIVYFYNKIWLNFK